MHRHIRWLITLACIAGGGAAEAGSTADNPTDRAPLQALLAELDPDVVTYDEHLVTLANPFMEGRAPGTRGNAIAATYIEQHFRDFGLDPAFPEIEPAVGGEEVVTPFASYRQTFPAGSEATASVAYLRYSAHGRSVSLDRGEDFVVMDFSASEAVTGGVAFVGYSIDDGPEGYSSYPEDADLSGRVAMMLRFEPMDQSGRSRFTDGAGWSPAAALASKFEAAVERGAEGIILVNPPEADDPRVGRLAGLNSFTAGGDGLDVPVFMMSPEAADELIRSATGDEHTLTGLGKRADEGPGLVDLDAKVIAAAEIERDPIMTDNVAGLLRGRGELAEEYMVIGAHYDHVGYGRYGSRGGPDARGKIHPGADDNASGTAGVLLLAERLAEAYENLPAGEDARSIVFMLFSAEEMGLVGSRYYVSDNTIADTDDHHIMLNLDMIGRLRNEELEVHGLGSAEGLEELVDPHFSESGLSIIRRQGGTGPSDHSSFYSAGIPVLFFHTGLHDEYHLPTDVTSTVNRTGAVRVCGLVEDIAMSLATRDAPLKYIEAQERGSQMARARRSRVNVRSVIAPGDYSGSDKGVVVGQVFPGTAAAEAGLQAGDRIIAWNGQKLETVQAWMPMLADHEPGDEVKITFVRDGEEMTGTCTLRGRNTGG